VAIASRGFRELRLQRTSRDFGMHNALKDMTLTIKRGEFIALLAPSLRQVNGLAGLLRWQHLARRHAPRSASARRVASPWSSEKYALFPRMSVQKNSASAS
jgi:putative spermidine/putrescine transport system ATP-binding protein